MIETKTPFKVGETYPDGDEGGVEIIHIRQDDCDYPVIGICRQSNGDTSISEYTLKGVFDIKHPKGAENLIPPALPMKRVPLGPEDVPPGSVVSSHPDPDEDFSLVYSWTKFGFQASGFRFYWEDCVNNTMQWKPPGGEWQPMWKEAPEDSTNE